jgi:ATP-dependent Lon protease
MACALVSLISQTPVRHDVAMTGELTLRGKVLPIGGLKEKLLAAVRAGMTAVIIPYANAPELTEIPEHVRSKLTITPVRTMAEVLALALAPVTKGKTSGKDAGGKDGGGGGKDKDPRAAEANGAKPRSSRNGGKTLSAGSRRSPS